MDIEAFTLFFKSHGTQAILDQYQIPTFLDLSKIKKTLNIKLTKEEQNKKNAISVRESTQRKYGVDNVFQLETTKEKIRKTSMERYGVINAGGSVESLEKIKATNNAKYGCDFYMQTDEFIEKSRCKMLELYGVDFATKSAVLQEKIVTTSLKKYGSSRPQKSEAVKEKAKQTCLERYGGDGPMSNLDVQEKSKTTCKIRYGTDYYNQTTDFHKKARKYYTFNGDNFDSLPEAALYVYALDHNESIERHPCKFSYCFNDTTHYYFPDFKYNGQLIEIKGDHFFKADGTMCNPFDHTQDNLYEAKHQCALANNVQFLKSSECEVFIKYLRKNYRIINKQILKI